MAEIPNFTGLRLPDSGSLVSDTIVFKHTETAQISTGPYDYVPDSVSVSINTPSGLLSPTVAIIPGTSNPQQLFQALVNETPAGVYNVAWIMNVGGQIVQRTESYFVAWTDLYAQVRSLLRVDNTVIQNSDIDLAVTRVILDITGPGMYQDVLPSYNSLIPGDRVAFDNAVALTAAATIRPFIPKQEATGDVVKYQAGQDLLQWAPPTVGDNKKSIEEMWLDQAFRQLVTTTTIGGVLRKIQQDATPMRLAGRRRRQTTPFVYGPMGEIWLNPGFLQWTSLYSFGREAMWSWLSK